MSENTPIIRFKQNTLCLLENICDIVLDLKERGETDLSTNSINAAKFMMKEYKGTFLLDNFIKSHSNWHHVKERDLNFIVETVPKTYQNIPFDKRVFVDPISKYIEWSKNKKYVEKIKGIATVYEDEEDWPINGEDIETFWNYFESMIKISCKYIHENRKPKIEGDCLVYEDPSFKKDIDLNKYIKMFNIELTV